MKPKSTLYKQRTYVELYKGYKGTRKQLAALIGCTQNTIINYIKTWNDMSPAEREKAYREALAAIEIVKNKLDKPFPTKSMFTQRGYVHLYENRPGSLAKAIGCASSTANAIMRTWFKMTDSQKKIAYAEALADIKKMEVKATKKLKPDTPVPTMDGFRTPYNVLKQKRSRMFISRY